MQVGNSWDPFDIFIQLIFLSENNRGISIRARKKINTALEWQYRTKGKYIFRLAIGEKYWVRITSK